MSLYILISITAEIFGKVT